MLVEEVARRRTDERPSEAELQAIAKAEFQNQLASYCDMHANRDFCVNKINDLAPEKTGCESCRPAQLGF